MPTGAGKSLCYQLPALLFPGYTLIVSPLIALMADQVSALNAKSIPAAFINSSIGFQEQLSALRAAEAGELKLLYIAPERLQNDIFRDFIKRCPPDMLVVDEAHCISEWGHDFRPGYRKIGIVAREAGISHICAFTATATPLVCSDIAEQLLTPDMELTAAGFRRPNLAFQVKMCEGGKETKLRIIKKLLSSAKVPTLIYAATRQAVDELSKLPGVRGYHAGMSIDERNSAQEYFMRDPAPVLAATNAFGMGIDRPDVRRVIHYQLPGSLEAYYQEAGRAGRDGEAAECILLFSFADKYVHEFLIGMNNPPPEVIRSLYRVLRREFLAGGGSNAVELTASALKNMVTGAKSDGQISAALGILEKSGAVRRLSRQNGIGEMRFTADPDKLRVLHQEEKSQRSRFIHRVCSKYKNALLKTGEYSIEELAETAGLSEEQTRRVINALSDEVLEWRAAFAGRAVELTDVDMVDPPVDDRELERRLDYELDRLEMVISYALSKNCRQLELIGYFGEKPENWQCGCCDICAGSREDDIDASPADIRLALRAAEQFNGRVGIGKLGQILAGSRSASIISGNWHRNPCFGVLRHLKSSQVEKLLRSLENCGDLERVERGGYPCIKLSKQGFEKLYQKQ